MTTSFIGQSHSFKIGILKYNGGGDWYANPTALKNLIQFCNTNLNTNIDPMYDEIEVGNLSIFQYPWVHLTGHGNVVFSPKEANNLRNYLIGTNVKVKAYIDSTNCLFGHRIWRLWKTCGIWGQNGNSCMPPSGPLIRGHTLRARVVFPMAVASQIRV